MCIINMNMPDMDGLEFIKEFRITNKDTPIVLLSSNSDILRIIEGDVKHDISGFIIKPFQFNDLVGVIKRVLR